MKKLLVLLGVVVLGIALMFCKKEPIKECTCPVKPPEEIKKSCRCTGYIQYLGMQMPVDVPVGEMTTAECESYEYRVPSGIEDVSIFVTCHSE